MTILNKFLLVSIFLVSVFTLYLWLNQPQFKKSRLQIGKNTFLVEVAKTPSQKTKGLGNRDRISKKEGMIFIHSFAARHPFWMKGMRFDLDFIFIRDDKVIEVIENIPAPKPGESPQYVLAKIPFTSVVELNAGSVARFGITPGDIIILE